MGSESGEDLRVLVVEDDRRTREGLAALIGGTEGFRCVGSYGSIEETVARSPESAPDVVLLDIGLPGVSGSEGIERVLQKHPETVVLMLTVFEDEERIFESLCNGASGYLLKKTPPARLLEAIGEADAGGAPMSPEVAAKVVRLFRTVAPRQSLDVDLTPRETELLDRLAEGHTYRSAAGELGVSINTVRNYVRSVYEKLHVHSKSEAVSTALRAGLI